MKRATLSWAAVPFAFFLTAGASGIENVGTDFDLHANSAKYAIDYWREGEGLPHSRIRQIVQTRDGYLWLGTDGGLARFDGVSFTLFNTRTGSLKDNEVWSLKETHDGALWIGTAGGGATLLKDGQFVTFTVADGLADDFVRFIHEGSNGDVWFGTIHGVTRYSNGTFRTYTSKAGLADDVVRQIDEDAAGNIWIATDHGVSRFAKDVLTTFTTKDGLTAGGYNRICALSEEGVVVIAGGRLHRFKDGRFLAYDEIMDAKAGMVVSISSSRDGALWATFERGLVKRIQHGVVTAFPLEKDLLFRGGEAFEGANGTTWLVGRDGLLMLANGEFRTIALLADTNQFGSVLSRVVDREGSLWIGLEANGLARLRRTQFITLTAEDGLPGNGARTVFQDSSGCIWIGTTAGLARFCNGGVTSYGEVDGTRLAGITSIAEDSHGTLWVGAAGQLLKLADGRLTKEPGWKRVFDIKAIYRDPQGRMWAATDGDGLVLFDDGKTKVFREEDGLASNQVRAVLMDRHGALWVATNGGGVSRYADGKFTTYSVKDGLGGDRVVGIYEDDLGALWFATRGGLTRYQDGKFVNYTTREGMLSNFVSGMLDDSRGNFWLSCGQGIFRVSKADLRGYADGKIKTFSVQSFGVNDGMKTTAFGAGLQPCAWRTADGRLLFCSLKGLVVIDPSVRFGNAIVPPVYVEQVLINRKTQPVGRFAEVAPGGGDVEIHYAALSYLVPEKVRFKYQLEGYDRDWVDAGTRRFAYYANLAAGSYRFRVIACNDAGIWNNQGSDFAFRLQPHFYQTVWFYALCAVGLILLVGGVFELRLRQLKANRENLRQKVAEAVAEIKVLSGMLPICSGCKKVRDDRGYWNQIETYLKEHSDTTVTHGLCPDCMRSLYPDLADEVLGTKGLEPDGRKPHGVGK
jgi:ligand-binding sensor domain-containing protein